MKASSVSLLLGVSVLLLSGLTVSADSQVTLEIPALPVMVGSDVTLCCRSKDQNALEAFFIRDGSKLGSGPEGQFTIRNINQSDEGLYWCYFDVDEQSPRRWLSVRDDDSQVTLEISALPVVAGSDVTLHCRNKDHVSLKAFFIRDGSELGSGPGQFTIRNFQQSDEGLYWCYFDQKAESPRRWLRVTDSQVILQIPARPVMAGSDVTLRCRSKDQVALEAFFFRDGSKLGSGPGQFTIRNISQSDEGLYWCYFDVDAESPRRWLSVRDDDAQVTLEIHPLPVMAGSDVTLRCRIKDQAPVLAFFFRDGSELGSGPKGQFTIRNISQSDEGLYWCYFDQTEESPRRRLRVTDSQVILEIPALPVVAGSDVTLRCRSKDQVALEAFFFRDGSKLGSGPEGQFTIRNISQSDEGLYWCYFDQTAESPRRWLSVTGPIAPSSFSSSSFSLSLSPPSASPPLSSPLLTAAGVGSLVLLVLVLV